MTVVTSNTVAGRRVVRTLGLVRGNTIRARHTGNVMSGAAELLAYGTAVVVEDT